MLYRRARILILDEPTAVLTPTEIDALLNILQQLVADNHTIIFITHKLDEVMAVSDAVTILRRGQVVASLPTAATNRYELAKLIVEREVSVHPRVSRQSPGETVLEVQNLWVNNSRQVAALKGISLQLQAGEILGIAGIDGNGQRELADAIAGLVPAASGSIRYLPASEHTHPEIKFGYIPEDRQKQGLVLSFSIARNLILKVFQRLPFCKNWVLQTIPIAEHAQTAIQTFDIRAQSPNLKANQLSGGNQQKVILARELAGEPQLIIAMQPTRGLDISATEYVQQCLLAQRARGAAVLYISTELEELMAMSDRIAVLYGGQLIKTVETATVNLEMVGLWMVGGHEQGALTAP